MKKILCVIDFAENPENILQVASALALKEKSKLDILYPYRLLNFVNGSNDYTKSSLDLKAQLQFKELERFIDKKVFYEFIPEIGFASDRINFHVAKGSAEAIVMGKEHVKTIAKEKGMSIEEFTKKITVPVILVPEEKDANLLLEAVGR